MKEKKRRKRRIGIFGGTFSPIHYGHLICAEKVRQDLALDSVEFVVSANPPNKTFGVLDAEERYDMVVAATEDNPHFNASRIDLEHAGTGYSLLTVEAIKRKYAGDELFYLTSAEYLDPEHQWYLPRWVGAKELFKICTFVVFPRDKQDVAQAQGWADQIKGAKIVVLGAPSPPLSSTLIRDLVLEGKSLWYTTPWVVQQMIFKKGHYRIDTTPAPNNNPVAPESIKRLAIYESQFDPIHYGNLLFAEWVRQAYAHDRVVFVPSANPPNNQTAQGSAEARYRMTVAATADNPFFDTSRVAIDRNTVSYAILTVEDMRRKYGSGVEIDWIVSSKYLEPASKWYLPKWMGAEEIAASVRFLVYLEPASSHGAGLARVERNAARLRKAGFRIEVVQTPTLPVASDEIRLMVSNGKSISYMTPWVVKQTIAKTGLYA